MPACAVRFLKESEVPPLRMVCLFITPIENERTLTLSMPDGTYEDKFKSFLNKGVNH